MEEEDTIELIDLLRVIWKWKWMIILLTFVCMVAAGAASIIMPRVYKASMIIEPAVIGVDGSGNFIFLNKYQNIAEMIREGVYKKQIQEEMRVDPSKLKLEFKVEQGKSTDLIKVTSELEEDKIEIGLEALEKLYYSLAKSYEDVVGFKRNDFDKQILMEQNKIKEIEIHRRDMDNQIALRLNDITGDKNQIKLQQANLSIAKQREEELMQEIREIKNNTERIVQQRDTILQQKGNSDDISLLLYSTTIQQNVAYFNQLSDQISGLKMDKENVRATIEKLNKEIADVNISIERLKLQKTEGLQTEIDDSQAKINRLNLEKGLVRNIKLVKPPEVSPVPIRPKIKLNVILTGFVGFFVSIFLAFFIQYIQRMKSYPQTSGTPSQTSSGKDQES